MVSDEEVLEWGRKNYPEFADDIEFLRKLWNKIHGGKKLENGRNMNEYKSINLEDVCKQENGSRVKIPLAIVIETGRVSEYEGCSFCRKKKCGHNLGRTKYRLQEVTVMDKTDEMQIVLVSKSEEEKIVKVGDKITIYGTVLHIDGCKLYVDQFEFYNETREENEESRIEESDDREMQILKLIKNMKPVKKIERDIFEKFIERKGFTWEEIKPYIKVIEEDGKEVVIFDE